MANRDRGQSGGFYATLEELTGNAGRFISEDDLLFINSTGEAYQATSAINSSPISGTTPQLYAHLRSGSATSPLEPNWDFEVVFNDGVELRSGYGNRNTHGNKAIDFSRASESGNINKSGVVETVGVDEPRIGSNGLGIYGSYTNAVVGSNNYTQYSGSTSPVITPNTGDTEDPSLNNNAIKAAINGELGTDGIVRLVNQPIAGVSGDSIHASIHVKKGNSSLITFESFASGSGVESRINFNFDTEEITSTDANSATFKKLNNGWYRLEMLYTLPITPTSMEFRVWIGGRSTSQNGDYVYIYGSQLSIANFTPPYIETTTSQVTSTPDVATVPTMGNVPVTGEPFTIEVDCNALEFNGVSRTLFRNGVGGSSGFAIVAENGGVMFGVSDGSSMTFTPSVPYDSLKHRYTCTYNTTSLTISSDGVVIGSVGFSSTPVYDLSENVGIGSKTSGSNPLNDSIKAVRIIHRALTVEQIAARGGYNGE